MQPTGNKCVTPPPPMALIDSHSMRKAVGIAKNKTSCAENVTDPGPLRAFANISLEAGICDEV